MQTIKTIAIVLALLIGVAFLIAAWYVVLAVAVIFVLYLGASTYLSVRAIP